MKNFHRLLDAISHGLLYVSAVGLGIMTLVIGWQVFGRKVLNASPAWSESVALLLMLYFVMLAAAAGVHEGFHLRFRLLERRVEPAVARWLQRFINLVIAAFGAMMAWNGVALADFTSTHVIPTIGLSRSVAYWPFVLAGTMITIFAIEQIIIPRDDEEFIE